LSPDLSPIENVWGLLSRKVYANGQQYQTVDQLKAALKKCWKSISKADLKKFTDSMPMRIYNLISRKGYAIDY
jgi:transposase